MMRIVIYFAALLAVVACGNKTGDNASASDSAAVVKDTTTNVKVRDSEEENKLECKDRAIYNLKGDVKRIDLFMVGSEFSKEPFESIVFDEQGRLKIIKIEVFEGNDHITFTYPDEKSLAGKVAKAKDGNSFLESKMVRDAEGRLTEVTQNEFTYDAQGRVKVWVSIGWESSTEYKYTAYNDNGEPTKATFDGSGEGMDWKGTVTFKYTKRDAQGNWTQCERHFHYTEFGDSETPAENDETSIISRKIVYNNQ